jgi:hypothetical protein
MENQMATKEFCEFIEKVCELAGIPQAQSLYERADIQVDDIKFTLMDASTGNERRMNVYCDFGPLPNGPDREKVMFRLLDLNVLCFAKELPYFGIDTNSHHVVLTGRFPFDTKGALEVLNALGKLAAQAKEWQATYLLPEDDAAPGISSKGRQNAASIQKSMMAHAGIAA